MKMVRKTTVPCLLQWGLADDPSPERGREQTTLFHDAAYGTLDYDKTFTLSFLLYNVMAEKTQKSSASVDESARRIQRL